MACLPETLIAVYPLERVGSVVLHGLHGHSNPTFIVLGISFPTLHTFIAPWLSAGLVV